MVKKAQKLREEVLKKRELAKKMGAPFYPDSTPYAYGQPISYKLLAAGNAGAAGPELQTTEPVPGEVKKWAAANSRQPYTGSFTSGQGRYIFIAAGEKPTAGYKIEIVNIRDDGRGKLTVHYRVTGPPPGRMAAQVITYPYVLARIPAGGAVLEFVEER